MRRLTSTMEKKRHNKSKEELLQEVKQREFSEAQKKETERRRTIAKDTLFPILLKSAKSIRHAQQICKIFENGILTLHNNGLATKTLTDLDLAEHFKGDDEAHVTFREILEAFKEEKLNSCLDIIGGMSGAIDSFITQETTTRPLSELKTYFL